MTTGACKFFEPKEPKFCVNDYTERGRDCAESEANHKDMLGLGQAWTAGRGGALGRESHKRRKTAGFYERISHKSNMAKGQI